MTDLREIDLNTNAKNCRGQFVTIENAEARACEIWTSSTPNRLDKISDA